MSYWRAISVAAAFMIAAACGRNDRQATADSALNRDLSLANQVQPYPAMDSVSAVEGGYVAAPALTSRSTARSTVRTGSSGTTARRTTSRRSSTSTGGTRTTSGTSASSSGTVTTTSGGTVVKKNTKRDAAIGAAAGAVIGATTSRDKLKGAVIGGVIGGVLGGVIGNNVDKKRVPPPPQD